MKPARLLAAASLLCLIAGAATAQETEGRRAFVAYCGACHSVSAPPVNKLGPSLLGITGRRAGAAPGFRYSAPMKAFGRTWTAERLDAYLANPGKVVPGGSMRFRGLADAALRAAIIDYLAAQRPATAAGPRAAPAP